MSLSSPLSRALRTRAIVLAVVLWAFGLSTTTLLVGVWGRSVTTDQVTMTASALAVLDADAVADQITEWMVGELVALPGVSGPAIAPVIRASAESAPAREAVETIVTDLVEAASAPPGSETVIDVAAALEPLRPGLIEALEISGLPASPADVDQFLRQVENLVLSSAEPAVGSRPVTSARSTLTLVILVGSLGLISFGGLATRLSEEKMAMVRSLGHRLVVSALTFAVFLRVSAWAVDPRGGRSPVREVGSILLGSNLIPVLVVGLGGLAVSMGATLVIRRHRSNRLEPVGPSPEPLPTRLRRSA